MASSSTDTLRHWHCECGYHNAGADPCIGCHRRAPHWIRHNTRTMLAAARTTTKRPSVR
jgi:hypothetical protein